MTTISPDNTLLAQLPLGVYVEVSAIDIKVRGSFEPSRSLNIWVGRLQSSASWKGYNSQVYQWLCTPSIHLFPKRSLVLQIRPSRLRAAFQFSKASRIEDVTLKADALVSYLLHERSDGIDDVSRKTKTSTFVHIFEIPNGTTLDIHLTLQLKSFSFSTGGLLMKEIHQETSLQELPIATSPADILMALDGLQTIFSPLYTSTANYQSVMLSLVTLAGTLSQIHPIAQAVVTALSVPYQIMANEQQFKNDLQNIGEEVYALLRCLNDIKDVNAIKTTSVYEAVVDILQIVLEVADFLDEYLAKNRLGKLVASQFRQSLQDLQSDFGRLGTRLDRALLTYLAAERSAALDAERLQTYLNPPDRGMLEPGCMEGTREHILRSIEEWLDDVHQPNILWISGSPGAGKTTIASSIVRRNRRCSARFFFKHDRDKLRDPRLVWPAIAFDLSRCHAGIKQRLVHVAVNHPKESDVDAQFKLLISDPLTDKSNRSSMELPVVVIDALDEGMMQQGWKKLLSTLRDWSALPPLYKLIVTSRDYSVIEKQLLDVSKTIRLKTGGQGDTDQETSNDLRHFFKKRLGDIVRDHDLPAEWPGPQIIEELTNKAGGLFIWAETAVDFIGKGNCGARLALVLSSQYLASDQSHEESPIDRLYLQVLESAFGGLTKNESDLLLAILGAIVLAKNPLSHDVLCHLLPSRSISFASAFMGGLSPVIPISNGRYQVCHATFTDFILDPIRSRRFAISRSKQSYQLALACVLLMNRELKFNICSLETSHSFNSQFEDLQDRIDRSISPSLQYAARFWTDHLADVSEHDSLENHDSLIAALRTFFYQHLLHWLEVVSFLDLVHITPQMLSSVAQWISDFDSGLSDFARDASRFTITFRQAISESVPHIYLSALPFSPPLSPVVRHFLPQFPNTLSVTLGRLQDWPGMRLILRGHESHVGSVAFSPDGTRILSGSMDGTIRFWDANSGRSVGLLRNSQGAILSMALASNGQRIAWYSEDRTICICDAYSGDNLVMIPSLESDGSGEGCVAFSPEGRRIASKCGLRIGVFDAYTGQQLILSDQSHKGSISCVAFSPADGNRIASCATDLTICTWNATTGEQLSIFSGLPTELSSLAFSPDGTCLVSAAGRTIFVLDAYTGTKLVTTDNFRNHSHRVFSVAFSLDRKYLVSCSGDSTIRIWDAETGRLVMEPLAGHFQGLGCVAFSPDGKRLVSGGSHGDIFLWDVDLVAQGEWVSRGHNNPVVSVAFHQTGSNVISVSSDGVISSWDANSEGTQTEHRAVGERGTVAARETRGWIQDAAFSPNGTKAVSCDIDGYVRIWATDNGRLVKPPHKHFSLVTCVIFLMDNERIAYGDEDGGIHLVDLALGVVRTLVLVPPTGVSQRPIRSIASSFDGRYLLVSTRSSMHIWDTHMWSLLAEYWCPNHAGVSKEKQLKYKGGFNAVAISPDGSCVVSGGKSSIRWWDCRPAGHLLPLSIVPQYSVTTAVTFFPDGRRLISATAEGVICIWEFARELPLTSIRLGVGIFSLAVSPDGCFFVTGASKFIIRVWNTGVGNHASDTVGASGDDPGIDRKVQSREESGKNSPLQLDAAGAVAISDRSRLLRGWVHQETSDYSARLFWLPLENRSGFWWPRNTAVIAERTTRVDLSRFVHGKNWTNCRGT